MELAPRCCCDAVVRSVNAFLDRRKDTTGALKKKGGAEEDEEEDEGQALTTEQQAVIAMYQNLCQKLDALTNFHFTPKAAEAELSVRPNVSAIAIEEVNPAAVSDASLLAPEEMFDAKKKSKLVGDSELTQEEKKRNRANAKSAKRKREKQKSIERKAIEKLNPALGNKYAKQRALDELQAASRSKKSGISIGKASSEGQNQSSKQFFGKLADEQAAKKRPTLDATNKGSKSKKLKL